MTSGNSEQELLPPSNKERTVCLHTTTNEMQIKWARDVDSTELLRYNFIFTDIQGQAKGTDVDETRTEITSVAEVGSDWR